MTFRNWPKTLRHATFRGVPFFVEKDSIDVGRRLVTHEFMLSERSYIEDIGAETEKIHVTAYCVGDGADGQAEALLGACRQKGAGPLSVPLGRFTVRLDKAKRDFTKDKLGYIAVDLSFIRDEGAGFEFPVPYLADLVRQATGGLAGAVLGNLSGLFSTIGAASFVIEQAAGSVRDIAATLDVAFRSVALDAVLAPGLLQAVGDLYDNAEGLVDIGSIGNALDATSFVARDVVRSAAPLVDALTNIFTLARAAMAPDDIIIALAPLAAYRADEEPPAPLTQSAIIAARNDIVLAQTVRVIAIGEIARAVSLVTYTDRRQAIQARADVSEMIGDELSRVTSGALPDVAARTPDKTPTVSASGSAMHVLFTVLIDLQGRTSDYLSRKVATLAPVVTVTASASMPSLWWSQRLYGTAGRAAELRVRNGVKHPGFMPLEFEALAR